MAVTGFLDQDKASTEDVESNTKYSGLYLV